MITRQRQNPPLVDPYGDDTVCSVWNVYRFYPELIAWGSSRNATYIPKAYGFVLSFLPRMDAAAVFLDGEKRDKTPIVPG